MDDFNRQIGRRIDEFNSVHGWYGVGMRNLEGGMSLQLSLNEELGVKYMVK